LNESFANKKLNLDKKKKNLVLFYCCTTSIFPLSDIFASQYKMCYMKIRDLCAGERPREKMIERGATSLSNAELLAILLRTGTGKRNVVEVAQDMLKRADWRLDVLSSMSVDLLCDTDGVGPGKAVSVAAAFELGRRWFSEHRDGIKHRIASPEDVFRMMYPLVRDLENEECWAIYLNNSNHCLGKERLSVGGIESTVLDSKILLRHACEKKASGVILVHNHPSGTPQPSEADKHLTKRVKEAAALFDIRLLDHVIISKEGDYSFRRAQQL
jgi:DNA repair protein RadC